MNMKRWYLKRQQSEIRLSLDRLESISGYISKIENGSGIINKIQRFHTLPILRSEQKHLNSRRDEFESKLEDIEWKLRK